MPESVYLLVLGQGFTEAWYQLSKEEQQALWSKAMEGEKQAGARLIVSCKARWADEALSDWSVLEYPDMEAYRRKVEQLEQLNWWRYVKARTILGTKEEL